MSKTNYTSPYALAKSFIANRALAWELVKRDFVGRYKGSFMGLAWSFFHPMLMLFVYTFVFGVVFKAKWGGQGPVEPNFAAVLFSGMIMHGLLAESLNRSPGLITSQPNYVKKVVFPLEIMAGVVTVSAALHFTIGLGLLLVFHYASGGQVSFGVLLVPIVVLPLFLLTLGLTWLFSALGVYLRDIGQVMGVATTVLMFLSPVFYPVGALPEDFRFLLYLNPITSPIEQLRAVLLFGEGLDWLKWGMNFCLGLAVMWFGFWLFQKLRRGFADVI